MSFEREAEMENANAHEVSAPNACGATTPESEVTPTVADSRQGILTESRYGLLLALGEKSQEFQTEDSCFRRIWRLISVLGMVPPGKVQKKMLKKCDRSRYVYENRQICDKMPGRKSDIFV